MNSAGDLTGALIADKYELLRLMGRGGMGAVYEARNVTTLRRCAVKVLLSPELAGDSEIVKRFFREAKASGLIESEHVVAAFDSGIDAANRVYYVMERLEGEDLEQTLTRLGLLNPVAAAKIALQAATGLASAHALGIVHRDVKPANLFLAVGPGDEIKVKILDFGVAKVKMEVFNESMTSLTHGGTLLGTPLYMSPEQLRRASAIDDSADVWSLGVVLFECLTGELPWGTCDGIGELVTAILTLRLPLIQDLSPWVKPELAEVAQRALSRDPQQRLTRARELRDALLKMVDGDIRLYRSELTPPDEQERHSLAPRASLPDTIMLGPHSGAPVVAQRAPTRHRRRAAWPVALGGLALAGAAVWTLGRSPAVPQATTAPTSAFRGEAAVPPPVVATLQAVDADTRAGQSFPLAVVPPSARVLVDGVEASVVDGQVMIEGASGSVHRVRLSLGPRAHEERVIISADGVVPSRVGLPPPKPAVAAPPKAPETTVVAQPPPSPIVASEPAAAPGVPTLSPHFE